MRRLLPILFALLAVSLFFVYRWAEPDPNALKHPLIMGVKSNVSIRIDNGSYEASADGRNLWKVSAKRIEVERMPGASLTEAQAANLEGITDGQLYGLPPELGSKWKTEQKPYFSSPMTPEKPDVTFRADAGRYALNDTDPLPAELTLLYRAKWQLKLTGNVVIKTVAGDTLTAPNLTMLELERARDRKIERRLLCPQGAVILVKREKNKPLRLTANTLRFNPDERTLEGLKGIAVELTEGNLQTEHLYFSLKEEVLFLPENSSGRLNGAEFTAENMTLNLKEGRYRGKSIQLRYPEDLIREAIPR